MKIKRKIRITSTPNNKNIIAIFMKKWKNNHGEKWSSQEIKNKADHKTEYEYVFLFLPNKVTPKTAL